MTGRPLSILANNGDIGGGEVMLLALAEAARDAGYEVTVVAPASPGACADAAAERELSVVRIPGEGRRAYMRGLRAWAKGRDELLWCSGLVPATATALLPARRVVHLHRLPEGLQRAAVRVARRRSMATVVPSRFMGDKIPGTTVLRNWTEEIAAVAPRDEQDVFRLGYLGRLAPEKGVTVLLNSLRLLQHPELRVECVVAGEVRFASEEEGEEIRRAIADAGDRVTLVGWMDRDAFLSQVDALVVPSVGPESFALTAAEAMAAGVPVVVTDAGALPEVVGAEHPFVARRNDSEHLAHVISRMMDDPIATAAATRAARERWEKEFSPTAGAARFVALLGRLTPGREGPRGANNRGA